MDFVYFFRVLFKRKWLIILAGIVAGGIAYLLTRDEPKLYLSTSQISTGYTIRNEISIKDENYSFFEADSKFNNVILIFKSQAVVSLLSYNLLLHDLEDSSAFRGFAKGAKDPRNRIKLSREEIINLATEKLESMQLLSAFNEKEKQLLELLSIYGYDYRSLLDDLKIARLQRTDYIQVEALTEDPELSSYEVNTLIDQFRRYYTHVRDTRSLESIDTLKSIMDKKKVALTYKRAFLTGEGAVNVEMENSSSLERITNLEKNLTDEKTKQTNLYYSLRKVNQRIAMVSPGKPDAPADDVSANSELLTLKRVMNDTYEAYVNGGSTDKALLNKYNQIKSDYQSKFAEITRRSNASKDNGDPSTSNGKSDLQQQKSDLEIDIQATEANIASIQSRIDSLKGNVIQGASKAASVETLMKEVELANKEYLDAKQKYSDAIDVSSSFVNNFRVILPGQPSTLPEPSKKALVIGLSAIAAMLATVLIIVLLTYLDSSIKTPNIFAKTVNLKLISMINYIKLEKGSLIDILGDKESPKSKGNSGLSVFRESLRKLRYEIEMSGKKIFLFTSTMKGEGKTTLIQALAYSMSLSKRRILIIDTNFCNNDLTVQLKADPILEKIDFNTSEYRTLIEGVRSAATPVGTGTVSVIGSQGGDYTPSEILASGNILEHLQDLKEDYDYIFLEGSPLNDFSDSRELANYVEGVIAIFSATHIIKQIDKESLSFFKDLNGKFTGSVLNMVEMKDVNVT